MLDQDTIAAIATPVGVGGIGVIRVSGPAAIKTVARVFKPAVGRFDGYTKSHTVRYGKIVREDQSVVDEVLVTLMKAPLSYTREDVVEISCHGGPVPLRDTLALLLRGGARLAEPGEFTKRAFLNGRMDLSQAEAVCDLIYARTSASGKMAAQQLSGALSRRVSSVRKELVAMLAEIDAGIDFPEHDVPEVTRKRLSLGLKTQKIDVDRLLETAATGRVFREGVKTALVGRPNSGKSSLLNALLGHERAIVTDVPGTTRDVIEETANIQGIPFVLSDTAGLRRTDDVVEKIGVDRAFQTIREADVTLLVLDGTIALSLEDTSIISSGQAGKLVIVVNKSDLTPRDGLVEEVRRIAVGIPVVSVSALNGSGLADLETVLVDLVTRGAGVHIEAAMVANARHEKCLLDAREALDRAINALEADVPYDLTSIDIRAAADALGGITGETASEEIVEAIFSRFCIGK